MQKAGRDDDDHLCVWDYHVILIYHRRQAWVYDLDTTLAFPTQFNDYFDLALRDNSLLLPKYHRMYRVISSGHFLDTFASDRSHMIRKDGSWSMPPPQYDCIRTEECAHNLDRFISMENDDPMFGEVLDSEQFKNRFIEQC